MKVELNHKIYHVEDNHNYETKQKHLQRYAAFLKKLNNTHVFETIVLSYPHFGGVLAIDISLFYDDVFLINASTLPQVAALEENLSTHRVHNVRRMNNTKVEAFHVFVDLSGRFPPKTTNCVYLCPEKCPTTGMEEYFWKEQETYVYLPQSWRFTFETIFQCHDNTIYYDNLVEVCMIVKNGGKLFQEMILHNRTIVDHWTIVDTGSTDDTIQIIEKEIIEQQKGTLFFCDFENFEQARNYALDCCQGYYKFTMILDDSYKIHGNFRQTLEALSSQEETQCYSYHVERTDIHFLSSRLFPTYYKLRFKGKILEQLETSLDTVKIIPPGQFYIEDCVDEASTQRTLNRQKDFEIPILEEKHQQEPHNEHTIFQLGELYRFLHNWDNAIQYYEMRLPIKYQGSLIERWNTAFELGRIHQNHQKSERNVFSKYYELAKQIDPSRPESDFMMGIHYFEVDQWDQAFSYFKIALDIGIPEPFFFKPTMYYFYIPHYVLRLAIHFRDGTYAMRATKLLEQKKRMIEKWQLESHLYVPFYLFPQLCVILNQWIVNFDPPTLPTTPLLCFIVPFGWTSWKGQDMNGKGIGGSETFIIQLAEMIAISGEYDVHVFCDCSETTSHQNVIYSPLGTFSQFAKENYIRHCVVNRCIAHTSLAMLAPHVENVNLILHDFMTEFDSFHDGFKLKNVFCVSKELEKYLTPHLPCPAKIRVLEPAIPSSLLQLQNNIPFRFHYSSTANRGLYVLLQLWPEIYRLNHDASLHIYSDLDNHFARTYANDEIEWIKKHQKELCEAYNVVFHGFVGKTVLYDAWDKADIWLYPCTFTETFCMTALEAAATRTLVISCGSGGLASSIGNRGIIIPGDPRSQSWKNEALLLLQQIFSGKIDRHDYTERNYHWAQSMTWGIRAKKFHEYLKKESFSFFSSQSMITHRDRNVLKSLIHACQSNVSVLLLGDEFGAVADYFFRELTDCRLTIVNEERSTVFFQHNAKQWTNHTLLKNTPLNALIHFIKKNQKFDIIYVNKMPKQNVILNNAMFLIQSGGILLVEKQKENSFDVVGLQTHFENADFAIYSKTHISPPCWKPNESFLFSRDVQWEKMLAQYLTPLQKNVVEVGVGNSSLYCYNSGKNVTSFMWDSPFVDSFRCFASSQGFDPIIHIGPPISITKHCVLIINNLLLADEIDDFSNVEHILIRNNVSTFEQKLQWEKKLKEHGFVLENYLHSEHNICPFRYIEHWEKHEKMVTFNY